MKPNNHTEDCECLACVPEVPVSPGPFATDAGAPKPVKDRIADPPDAPGRRSHPPQHNVQWKFDPVRGQWWPRVPLAKDEQRRWSLERRLLYYVVEIERFEQRYEDLVARQASEDRLVPIDAHLDQVLRPALRGITAALIALGGPLP